MQQYDPTPTAKIETVRDLNNYKPYRTAAQKERAKEGARKYDGHFTSGVQTSQHKPRKDLMGKPR